jgi:hypothetical protein
MRSWPPGPTKPCRMTTGFRPRSPRSAPPSDSGRTASHCSNHHYSVGSSSIFEVSCRVTGRPFTTLALLRIPRREARRLVGVCFSLRARAAFVVRDLFANVKDNSAIRVSRCQDSFRKPTRRLPRERSPPARPCPPLGHRSQNPRCPLAQALRTWPASGCWETVARARLWQRRQRGTGCSLRYIRKNRARASDARQPSSSHQRVFHVSGTKSSSRRFEKEMEEMTVVELRDRLCHMSNAPKNAAITMTAHKSSR